MEFALGVLHWTEAAFWATSLRAYDRAVSGYSKANQVPGPEGMTRERMDALMAEYPD